MNYLKQGNESMGKLKKGLDIFSGLKRDTIRRNSQRSVKWLVNKIQSAAGNKDLVRSVPKLGGMYLYAYDAKFKDKLPFWDAAPLVVPVQFEAKGFSGINFHYLPVDQRLFLFKLLAGMRSNTSRRYIRISYKTLVALSTSIWKFAYKRYLFSHVKSRLLVIDKSEWEEALMLPVANFQKKTASFVYKEFSKKF